MDQNKKKVILSDSNKTKSIINNPIPKDNVEKVDKYLNEYEVLDEFELYDENYMQQAMIKNNNNPVSQDEPLTEPEIEEEEEIKPIPLKIKEITSKEKIDKVKKDITKKIKTYTKNIKQKIKKNTTNLNSKIKEMPKKVKYASILIILLISSFAFYKFYKYEVKINTYNIELLGQEEISLYEGEIYEEDGVKAINYENIDNTDKVNIEGTVDTETVGEYNITYSINSFWKKNYVTRKVHVLENPLGDIVFSLVGDEDITIDLNSEYQDEGYSVRSEDNQDYSEYITTYSNVNTNKVGDYQVSYLIKISDKQRELIRNVHVTGPRYEVNYNKEVVNSDITINISSNINDFDYFIVDGNKILQESIEYKVSNNGTYKFELVSSSGISDEINVSITNIDKTPPSGSCNGWMSSQNKNTVFKINATDDHGISKYVYNGKTFTTANFTVDGLINKGNVTIYDVAGNSSELSCAYGYGAITPKSNSKVVKKFSSDTLYYWTENAGSNYYITHIWVKDAYSQFGVGIPKEFPQLDTATNIMSITSNKYNYYSKAMIGANASGFVTNSFNYNIAKKYPEWKWSSKSPLVIVNSKVLRNYTNLDLTGIGVNVYGLGKNGYLTYEYIGGSDTSKNQKRTQNLINAGVKNTFAFSPVLIHNGKIQNNLGTDKNIRQAIGQIDKNNFVIVSNTNNVNNRTAGFSFSALANTMKNLGCTEAYNMDGGGSTNLVYKNRNTNKASSLITTSRDVADIIYFVEQ